MNIHEYQGKEIFCSTDVVIPEGRVIFIAEEAVEKTKELNSGAYVVKAQIHAGDRDKAGGVKITKSLSEVEVYAKELLRRTLVTHQTGPEGKEIKRLYIEEGCAIQKEYYARSVIGRATDQVALMASEKGGTEIEKVTTKTSEEVFKETTDPVIGLSPFQARRIAFNINIPKESVNKVAKLLLALYNVFIGEDCSVVEINPLVTTTDGGALALDAKISFNDNTSFRHKGVIELHDLEKEDPKEIETFKYGLSHIALDDDIGCIANGTSLAVVTMDTIDHFGGDPVNFLGAGENTTRKKVTEVFKIILGDENVRGIFVNISGGIMKCNTIAEGIVETAKEIDLALSPVIRLGGTSVKLGKKILKGSGLAIEPTTIIVEGVQKIIKLVKEA